MNNIRIIFVLIIPADQLGHEEWESWEIFSLHKENHKQDNTDETEELLMNAKMEWTH